MKRIIFFLILFFSVLRAGDRGKLVGTIRDATTLEPLVGVNVFLINTTLGAVTDENGFYFINNIPPKNYSIKISSLGFQTIEVSNIRITADATLEYNISLSQSLIELNDAVIIVAEPPLIQKDRTSTQTILDGETISKEIRLTSFTDILSLQAGVTIGADGGLHIRGGRSGGVVYQIDGIATVNPFNRSFSGLLEVDRVEELQVYLGTFDAEFGNASDGVVSVLTRDGTEDYKFKLQLETPSLNNSPYHQKDWNLNRNEIKNLSESEKSNYKDEVRKPDGTSAYDFVSLLNDSLAKKYLLIPIIGTFNSTFSGPVPFIPSLTFFSTTRMRNENSALPNGYNLFRSSTLKLTYPLTSMMTLKFAYDWSEEISQNYSHQYKYWKWFNSGKDISGRKGSYSISKEFSNRQMFQFRHVLNKNNFYDLSFSRIYDYDLTETPNRTVAFDNTSGDLIFTNYVKRDYVGGIDGSFRYGDVRYFTRVKSTQYLLKGNFESQLDNFNQMRSGFEIKNHTIFRHRIGMPPLENLQFFTEHPIDGSFYLQDKLEFNFMILKVGLRLDYFDPATNGFSDLGNILQVVTLSDGTTSYITTEQKKIKPSFQLSPRLGIAHPISSRTSIHFAYGHFFQIPTFYDLYRNDGLNDILVNDALIGNPSLQPEKTVSFELGLQHQFSDDWALNLTAFSKDITNLTSSFYYFVGRDYTIFTNSDFGRVQGIDFTLDKRFSNFYSGRITYSLLYALGNQSDPSEGYNSYREDQAHLRPNRNYFLDFDQRHKINLIFSMKLPENFGIDIFGFSPFESTSLTTIVSAGSGLPYTPTSRSSEETNIVPEPNSARKPSTFNLDLKLTRNIKLNNLNLNVYFDIENFFDNENVVLVWTRTGEALSQGPTSIYSKDFQSNPENFGPRRNIRAGVILEF